MWENKGDCRNIITKWNAMVVFEAGTKQLIKSHCFRQKSERGYCIPWHQEITSTLLRCHNAMGVVFKKEKGPYWLEMHAEALINELTRCLNSALCTPGKKGAEQMTGKMWTLLEPGGGYKGIYCTTLFTCVCLKISIIQGLAFCFALFFLQKQVNQKCRKLNRTLLYFFLKYFLL